MRSTNPADNRKRPVSTDDTRRAYRRNIGDTDDLIVLPEPVTSSEQSSWLEIKKIDKSSRIDTYLRHALWRWLCDRASTDDTRATYGRALGRWIARTRRRTLTQQQRASQLVISRYLSALDDVTESPRTVQTHSQAIRSWYGWLADHDVIGQSPWRRQYHQRRVVRRRVYTHAGGLRTSLTQAEAQRLADSLPDLPPRRALAVALGLHGLRRCEILRASGADYDPRTGLLLVRGKGGRDRWITLGPVQIAAWTRATSSPHETPGRPRTRQPLIPATPRTVSRWISEACASIGRPDCSTHSLRRTCATLAAQRGAGLEAVQVHLGHSSIELTRDCYDCNDSHLQLDTGLIC